MRLSVRTAVEDRFSCRTHIRLSGLINLIKKFQKVLSFDLRQRLAHRLSNKVLCVLSASHPHIVMINKRESVFGTAEESDEGWRLHEQLMQATALAFSSKSEFTFELRRFASYLRQRQL